MWHVTIEFRQGSLNKETFEKEYVFASFADAKRFSCSTEGVIAKAEFKEEPFVLDDEEIII